MFTGSTPLKYGSSCGSSPQRADRFGDALSSIGQAPSRTKAASVNRIARSPTLPNNERVRARLQPERERVTARIVPDWTPRRKQSP